MAQENLPRGKQGPVYFTYIVNFMAAADQAIPGPQQLWYTGIFWPRPQKCDGKNVWRDSFNTFSSHIQIWRKANVCQTRDLSFVIHRNRHVGHQTPRVYGGVWSVALGHRALEFRASSEILKSEQNWTRTGWRPPNIRSIPPYQNISEQFRSHYIRTYRDNVTNPINSIQYKIS